MSKESSHFRGVTVALITPFKSDFSVDEARLRRLVDWHIEQGTDVILACGTTGESATLSHEEHRRVIDIVIEQAAKRIPVLAGAGSNCTDEAVSLTVHAEQSGADGILSVAPYYNKPTQRGLYEHFKAIAQATKLPVILYNVPGRTSSNIAAETVLQLAEIPNIVGIKEASGNFSQIMEILRRRPQGFLVLSGDDALTLPMMALGAEGVVSVVANEAPAMMKQMVLAAANGDWDSARALHFKLLPLMEANFWESNPIPVKAACAMMGLAEDVLRLPLVPMSEANREKLRRLLLELGLIS
ncbi:MAG: 4-hydroxy-tetrahydrodipicolinate synthase [candidate division KSB1 bacterium]|nr:4-hydroxy-tetrahydrodipicolinate synthase [candidate division KSB1 bacterium]MDZ7346927.1 4-hydroxy-tetrahydrodipicolinate synthase [candidate division KSB1 bacterium]